MAARKGNKYAEKWKVEDVIQILDSMESDLLADNENTFIFLGQLFHTYNLYKNIWAYWKSKFSSNNKVLGAIKRIENKLETNLFIQASKNNIVASIAIFGLKNNHNWTDKVQTDITSGGEAINLTMDLSK